MMRSILSVLTSGALVAGLLVVSGAAPVPVRDVPAPPGEPPVLDAGTDWAWEPVGPVSGSAGMTAVATDPDNPKVLWIAAPTTVWVSEDSGATFHLVLQLSRAAGLGRASGSGDDVERDADPPEDTDPNASDDGGDDGMAPDRVRSVDDEDAEERADDAFDTISSSSSAGEEDSGDGSGDEEDEREVAFGITRLRPIGDDLWVCTSRGLWAVSRAARTSGTGRELRLARRVAVNDVAKLADGTLFIGADDGLWEWTQNNIGRTVVGFEAGLPVKALAVSGGRLFAGSSRGLFVGDGDHFERVGVQASSQDAGIDDIVVEPQGRVTLADGAHVRRLDPTGTITEEAWSLPGTHRLAAGKDGALWAVGSSGAWLYDRDAGWTRLVEGLFDRRMSDVAASTTPGVRLWIAGRSGAWRLVPETAHVLVGEAGAALRQALQGRPDADDTMRWAVKARGTTLADVDDWSIQERVAWLLPKVELSYRAYQSRQEERILIPSIDRHILDAVEVMPRQNEFRIMAHWDIMPAIVAALSPSQRAYETARNTARRAQKAIHDHVVPLWGTWAKKRVEMLASEPKTVRDAVREALLLAQLEADLHVLTGGRFPYEEPTQAPAPRPARPETDHSTTVVHSPE